LSRDKRQANRKTGLIAFFHSLLGAKKALAAPLMDESQAADASFQQGGATISFVYDGEGRLILSPDGASATIYISNTTNGAKACLTRQAVNLFSK
jgi:hypothetical protein